MGRSRAVSSPSAELVQHVHHRLVRQKGVAPADSHVCMQTDIDWQEMRRNDLQRQLLALRPAPKDRRTHDLDGSVVTERVLPPMRGISWPFT
jgi:hypothetical protein